ncbi:outer membrane protein assembly factor BamE domain-containing protein [Marinobacter sp. JSM 1782161]|uniref:outer membrane protein assembly factor BamE domain-containing protein n=1 Tax=Marinobacter sp. JSM 1782161 TaxID=2685906 RepID=UPI001402A309|nr:outer membrane protein assembly factor BamE [Marinobacter sp. JSM 1782161]
MKIAFSLVFSLLFLVGCASSGAKIERSEVDKITPGVTTYSEMESMFGNPISQGYNQNGMLTATWMHIFVGPFGAGMEQQVLAVVFNEDKTVRQYNLSDTDR